MNAIQYRNLSPANQVRARTLCPVDLDAADQSFAVSASGWVERFVPPAVVGGCGADEATLGAPVKNLGAALDGMRRPGRALLCFAGVGGYTVLSVGAAQ